MIGWIARRTARVRTEPALIVAGTREQAAHWPALLDALVPTGAELVLGEEMLP